MIDNKYSVYKQLCKKAISQLDL